MKIVDLGNQRFFIPIYRQSRYIWGWRIDKSHKENYPIWSFFYTGKDEEPEYEFYTLKMDIINNRTRFTFEDKSIEIDDKGKIFKPSSNEPIYEHAFFNDAVNHAIKILTETFVEQYLREEK